MNTIHELIRFNLRRIRRAKDITQLELAETSGFSSHAIQRIESGMRQPKLSTIATLAEALGVSELDFIALHREITLEPNPALTKVINNKDKKSISKQRQELIDFIMSADDETVKILLAYARFLASNSKSRPQTATKSRKRSK